MQTRSYRCVTVNPAIMNGQMKFNAVVLVKEHDDGREGTEREIGRVENVNGMSAATSIVAHLETLEAERQRLEQRNAALAKQVIELVDR